SGTNQPLFVVDGVPFATEGNSDRGFAAGGSTSSSRFLDLDPNNIAEISILKGLSATVLYGEAGRNGVVLVTTKNNDIDLDKDKGFEISVAQSLSQTQIGNLPDYQNTYGNGFSGDFGWFFSNWGPAFDARGTNGIASDGTIEHPLDQGQYNDDFPEFIGVRYPYQPYSSVEDFFQKGTTSNTSFSLSKNLGNGAAVSATYSYLDDQGFTPKLDTRPGAGLAPQRDGEASNFLRKHNFGLGARAELANGLNINATFNYVQSKSRIPPAGPGFGGDGNGLFAALLFTPRSIDLNGLPFQSPLDGSNVYYRRGGAIQNPYWTLNNSWDNEEIQRFYSSTTLNYEINDWLTATYRLGFNQYTEKDIRSVNRGGPRDFNGRLETSETLARTVDQVLNLTAVKQINEDLSVDVLVGVNFREEKADYDGLFSSNQFVYGFMNHGNFIDHNGVSFQSLENTIGLYATATVGFKNFLYLNLQGRNDWTSTLEEENRSFFYPSASLSFVASDAIPALQNNRVVDYLKMRVGFGTSAGYPNPYNTRTVLGSSTNVFVTPGGSVLNTNTVANRLGNPNLRPEKHEELEFGVEARFFKNRFGVDLSVFDKNSSDLIIAQDLDPATGSTSTTTNAAQLNTNGIELALDFVPVRTKNFTWDFTLNYTKVNSEVEKIADGVDQIQIAGFGGGLGNWAIPGQAYGVIQGQPFQKNDDGVLLVGGDGNYVPGSGIEVIGNPQQNFTANWLNNLSWKGISFGFQWQYIDGGDIYSSTVQAMLARGNTTDTDVDRFLPIAQPGVLASDGETPANIQGYIGDLFFRSYFFADEGGIFDGTVIRLREISLSYTLPADILKNTPFGSVGITFAGENLWYNAPNFPEGINFDPEVLSVGVGNGRGFDFRTGPTAKKYGVTLNATF
ncbi:MAG: TonB-dependent receptor, partial [Flavobacteriales bacterium]|nr:TonB-dependent receptor [Flavobacteriales bacterium]